MIYINLSGINLLIVIYFTHLQIIAYFYCHWPSFFQSCYVCLVFFFNTLHLYIHIYNWIESGMYTYIHYTYKLHYAYVYKYTQYILSEKGDHRHLLRGKLKLAKYPTSTTHYVLLLSLNYPQSWLTCLVSFMRMSRGKLPALIKSLAQAR